MPRFAATPRSPCVSVRLGQLAQATNLCRVLWRAFVERIVHHVLECVDGQLQL